MVLHVLLIRRMGTRPHHQRGTWVKKRLLSPPPPHLTTGSRHDSEAETTQHWGSRLTLPVKPIHSRPKRARDPIRAPTSSIQRARNQWGCRRLEAPGGDPHLAMPPGAPTCLRRRGEKGWGKIGTGHTKTEHALDGGMSSSGDGVKGAPGRLNLALRQCTHRTLPSQAGEDYSCLVRYPPRTLSGGV